MHRLLEFILPLASLLAIGLYYRPDVVPRIEDADTFAAKLAVWLLWLLIAAVLGVLAAPGVFLLFSLLYSPLYLARNLDVLMTHRRWVDVHEVKFYAACFVLLCLLGGTALVNATFAVTGLIGLAGSAPLLWRALL